MNAESFAVSNPRDLASRLAGVYVRVFLWFMLGVYLLWQVGIEGIYENVTPFYALYRPHFTSSFVPAILIGMAGLTYLVWSGFSVSRSTTRSVLLFVLCVTPTCVVLAATGYSGVSEAARSLANQLPLLARHAAALAVFVGFYAAVTTVLTRNHWPDSELPRRTRMRVIVAIVIFMVIFSGMIASMRTGLSGITQAYARTGFEYIDDIGRGGTLRGLFRDYVKILPYLSMHAKVHPPGPVALLWMMSHIVGRSPMALSLATMAGGAIAIVPLYAWVRDMSGPRTALTACMLYPLMPAFVLFTATSADTLFMPFTLGTLFLFWRALHRSPLRYGFLAGIGYGLMSLLSFSLLTVGAFFGLIGLWRLATRGRRAAVFSTAALMIAGFLAVHTVVRLWSGFDMIACFHANLAQFSTDQVHLEIITPRFPGWVWRIVNPFALLFFAGIPIATLFVLRLRYPQAAERTLMALLGLTFAITMAFYLARGEGERSAMYALPFVLAPAASMLTGLVVQARSLAPLLATAAFLAFQTWFIESYFYTYW